MLSPASWLPATLALDLQDRRSRRINHDCGAGRTLQVSRDGPRLRAWCHRCNDGGSHKLEEPLHERLARLKTTRDADQRLAGGGVPTGLTDPAEWPTAARLWFARAGLHSGDIGALCARYDPATGRVVLPLGPAFWQARAIRAGQQPKYLAPTEGKVYPRYGRGSRITLTEDILSAYKVGKVSEGWCMLGTSLPAELLALILASGKPVNVWLDNDIGPKHPVNRGQIAARKVVTQLRQLGVSVRNIVSKVDPKLVTFDEIKELTS